MPEEEVKPEQLTYYDEIRADVETAVYAYTALEEVDGAILGKIAQNNLNNAKKDCVYIICKGLKLIRDGYKESKDDE